MEVEELAAALLLVTLADPSQEANLQTAGLHFFYFEDHDDDYDGNNILLRWSWVIEPLCDCWNCWNWKGAKRMWRDEAVTTANQAPLALTKVENNEKNKQELNYVPVFFRRG